ncbi:hypothetical protein QR680_000243 [Steinernema hermaphroditum]|uniref:DH domain-containing protein n=1 Tax=Steinernema hermaphroditum TaxID=289476 RepID=A0AA39GVI7_9BILA|nr:hypothetical protein QR680_000243 [Steinernema hermaphroditum]
MPPHKLVFLSTLLLFGLVSPYSIPHLMTFNDEIENPNWVWESEDNFGKFLKAFEYVLAVVGRDIIPYPVTQFFQELSISDYEAVKLIIKLHDDVLASRQNDDHLYEKFEEDMKPHSRFMDNLIKMYIKLSNSWFRFSEDTKVHLRAIADHIEFMRAWPSKVQMELDMLFHKLSRYMRELYETPKKTKLPFKVSLLYHLLPQVVDKISHYITLFEFME